MPAGMSSETGIATRLREALGLHGGRVGEGYSSNHNSSGYPPPEDGCRYSTVRKSKCSVGKNSDGKPVMKCERTEQVLKHCLGRSDEVVESKSEYTEEDAPSENFLIGGHDDSYDVPGFGQRRFPFALPPGPFGDLDALPRGFESFFKAAEDMLGEVYDHFGMRRPGTESESNSPPGLFDWFFDESQRSENSASSSARRQEQGTPRKKFHDFTDLARDFEEV